MSKKQAARLPAVTARSAPPALALVEPAQVPGVSASFQDDKKARAKTLLQDLLFKADLYPEFAAHLEPSIVALTAETKRTTRSTRDKILLLLERAVGLTLEELYQDLLIPEDDLRGFLAELVGLGLVEEVRTGRRIDPNKGRVELYYKLTHSSPTGGAYVAPAAGSSGTRAAMDAFSAD